jgi:Crp-like helix-turn-helix domain
MFRCRFGKEGTPESVVPKVSQEMLAEMIGTTRSRVSFFMNRLRRLGFIDYNGGLQVHSSMLNVVRGFCVSVRMLVRALRPLGALVMQDPISLDNRSLRLCFGP